MTLYLKHKTSMKSSNSIKLRNVGIEPQLFVDDIDFFMQKYTSSTNSGNGGTGNLQISSIPFVYLTISNWDELLEAYVHRSR